MVNSQIAEDYYYGDLDSALEAHWNQDEHGEGELSELALRRRIRAHGPRPAAELPAKHQTKQQPKSQAPEREPQEGEPNFRAAAEAVGAKWLDGRFIPARALK